MREIKFRAWNKIVNKMALNIEEEYDDTCEYADGSSPVMAAFSDYFKKDEWEAVMQYTGLKDVNNKEIYHYDVVKRYWKPFNRDIFDLWMVDWYEPNMSWFLVRNDPTQDVKDRDWLNEDPLEVIGNVYENPDLLEKVVDSAKK